MSDATTKCPLGGGGTFVASWPETASAADLQQAHAWFNAVLGAWLTHGEAHPERFAALAAADAEYQSWLATPADLEFASWGAARKAAPTPQEQKP